MDHADHVRLLRDGIEGAGPVWADLGAGSGAFTLALADLLGPKGEIYAIDRDGSRLRDNARAMASRFPSVRVHYQEADFRRPVTLPPLDGVLMANALHFQSAQEELVQCLRGYLRPGGRFLIVEYDIDRENYAVPHPVPYSAWQSIARHSGFEHTALLATRPSRFLRSIYSAVSW